MMNMSRPYRLMPILGTRVQWSYSDSRGNGLRDTWQADSTASDPTRTVLTTHSGGYKKGIDAAVSLHDLQIWNTLSLNSSYQFNYDHSKSRQLAIDNMTGLIDSTVAFNYTRNYITQQLDERFVWFLREKSMEIRVGAIFKTSWSDRDEHMPRELFDRRTFISLLPQFTIGSRYEESFPSSPNWKVTYSAQSSEPSLESMRNWLDTKSSMSLELGNPSLKQSYTHSIDMNFFKSNVEESTTLNLSLSASYTHNDIATKRITFNQDTPLPEYDYTALAGSTLTTYENIDGAVSSALRFGLHNPVFKDKFILRSSLGFSFNRRPAYIADQKNFTLSSSPSLDLELRSNHSRKVEYRISSRTGYVYSSNTAGGDNKSFTQRAAFHLTLRLEHLEFNTSYMYYYYHSTKAADVNNNILNASLSYRFMKNRGELRIAAYDILNRNESFSSSVYSDYVQNTWRQVMSRYFTVTLGFRFNNSGMPSRPPRS